MAETNGSDVDAPQQQMAPFHFHPVCDTHVIDLDEDEHYPRMEEDELMMAEHERRVYEGEKFARPIADGSETAQSTNRKVGTVLEEEEVARGHWKGFC